ncbi:MAG: GNAT family protein [Pseudomonadota bacterium]
MSSEPLQPRQSPDCTVLTGQYVRLEKVDPAAHAGGFDKHLCGPQNHSLWDYIPFGAPSDSVELCTILDAMAERLSWYSFALRDLSSDEVCGTVSLMRIRPEHGSAEIGSVVFGKQLQRTRAATEAVFLLGDYLFSTLGYRRYEWKCDNLNAASKRAAERFGFAFEGVFRNDMIVHGRSRDTAWFAMTDGDWAKLRPAFGQWLSASNFDAEGTQIEPLRDLTRAAIDLARA